MNTYGVTQKIELRHIFYKNQQKDLTQAAFCAARIR